MCTRIDACTQCGCYTQTHIKPTIMYVGKQPRCNNFDPGNKRHRFVFRKYRDTGSCFEYTATQVRVSNIPRHRFCFEHTVLSTFAYVLKKRSTCRCFMQIYVRATFEILAPRNTMQQRNANICTCNA